MTTTVVVNTRRSTTPTDPESHRRQAAAGAWPIRASIAETAATCRWLVAVHRDKIAGVWAIESQRIEDGRISFVLQATWDTETFVGAVAPPGMRWRRGETWPTSVGFTSRWTRTGGR